MTYGEAYRVPLHPAKFSGTIINPILYARVDIVSEWKLGNEGSARSWHAKTMLRTLLARLSHLQVTTVVAMRRVWALLTFDLDGSLPTGDALLHHVVLLVISLVLRSWLLQPSRQYNI